MQGLNIYMSVRALGIGSAMSVRSFLSGATFIVIYLCWNFVVVGTFGNVEAFVSVGTFVPSRLHYTMSSPPQG